ncbi:hypothetical protein RintRC_0184 [Richelia intracellularis]|nr:hypothetical protein RintRC_0184 [Richelia intracellularis]
MWLPLQNTVVSISITEKQYKTYTVTDETSTSQIEVVPERGGIITRWRVQDKEILYLDEQRFTNPELSIRGGIPILFPICGNLPDNTYTYQGKQYTLKQHGFARDLPWNVDSSGTKFVVKLNSTEQTRAVYPFDFQLIFTYKIQGNALEIHQEYTNLSSEPMPFSAGFHPYLAIANKNKLELDIPAQAYQNQITKEIHPFDGTFDFNVDEIDVAFKEISSPSAAATDRERQLKLTLDSDSIFSTLVFWTVKGKEYYCLEPWTAPRNAINTGEKLTILKPGTTCNTNIRLTANFF